MCSESCRVQSQKLAVSLLAVANLELLIQGKHETTFQCLEALESLLALLVAFVDHVGPSSKPSMLMRNVSYLVGPCPPPK